MKSVFPEFKKTGGERQASGAPATLIFLSFLNYGFLEFFLCLIDQGPPPEKRPPASDQCSFGR
jgi:hypothetical protein